MRQKEILIREYFALKHAFDVNEGDNALTIFPAVPTEEEINSFSRAFKVIDLQDKIEAVKNAIEKQAEKIKIKEYFETEEGRKFKNDIETKISNLREIYKSVENSYIEKISNLIGNFLGDKFTSVMYFDSDSCHIEIGLKNTDNDRKGFTFEFGHSFNVYYGKRVSYNKETKKWEHEYALKMNYGTLGEFDVMKDLNRIYYLEGLGKFVADYNIKFSIQTFIKGAISELSKIKLDVEKYDNMLKNPKF